MAKLRAAECLRDYEAQRKEAKAAAAASRLKRKTSGKNLIKGALSTSSSSSSPSSSFIGKLWTDRSVSGGSAKSNDALPAEESSASKSAAAATVAAVGATSDESARADATDARSNKSDVDDGARDFKSNVNYNGVGDNVGSGGLGDVDFSLITSGGSVDGVTSSLAVGSLAKSPNHRAGDGEGESDTIDTPFASPNRRKGGLAGAAAAFATAATGTSATSPTAVGNATAAAGGSQDGSERGRSSSPMMLQRAAMRMKNKSSSPSSSVSPTNARGSARNANSNNSSSKSLVNSPSSGAGQRKQRMPSQMTSAVLMAAAQVAQASFLGRSSL